MSEAHEKTRIRQLEDAAAHWEHKYANARQYNRNLEERIRALEAALRYLVADVQDYPAWQRPCDPLDKAIALLTAAETGVEP